MERNESEFHRAVVREKTSRRTIIAVLANCVAVGSLSLTSTAITAQEYPSKPIRIVVPYPPGGAADATTRLIAQQLSLRMKQPVTVENKGGASEQVASSYMKSQPGDGHHIMLTTMVGMSTNPTIYGNKLPYDPVKDFAPVILSVALSSIVMVHPSNPANNMAELTAWLRAQKGAVSYSSAGAGAPSHIGMELYKRLGNFDATHVPYRGGAPALQALMAGETQIMMAIGADAMPMAKAGKLKPIAVLSAGGSAAFPGLPAVSETPGLSTLEMPFWFAYVVPTSTPKEIIARLNRELKAILHEPEMRKKLQEMGADVVGSTPEDLAAIIQSDTLKWGKVIRDSNITVD